MTTNKNINTLRKAVTHLQNQGPRMDLTKVMVFLLIARNDYCTASFIVDKTGRNQSTIARVLSVLGKGRHGHGKASLGWVAPIPDPDDPRRDILTLTRKGHALIKELEGLGA
jgi:DNA-binding MarR family transcriptional regulator